MANYLLDANHASPLVTIRHSLRARILAELNAGHTFAIAAPVVTETFFGISVLPRGDQNREEWFRLAPHIACIAIQESDAMQAAELQIHLRRRGKQLETVDALCATVALRYDLTLLTTDRDFDPIPNLRRENWLANPVT